VKDQPMHSGQSQRGFSLVEAMVSLVVISVGMIGIAALYGQGLSAGRTALLRTQAVNLVADMADRIRANRGAGIGYNAAPADNNCDTGGAPCLPNAMAAHDLWLWTTQVATQLPGGFGTVQVVDGIPPTYTVQVSWQEGVLAPSVYQAVFQVPAF
jgi:type IV pilus assembly protein PilV